MRTISIYINISILVSCTFSACTTVRPVVFHAPKAEKAYIFSNTNSQDLESDISKPALEKTYQYHTEQIQKQPQNRKLLINLATLAAKKGMAKQAHKITQDILKVFPGDPEATILMAKIYFRQKKFKVVQLICNNLLFKEVKHSEIYNLLGLSHFQLNNLPDAVSNFNKALKVNPSNLAARVNLGIVYLQYKDYHQAAKEFTTAIQKIPQDLHVQFYLAIALSQTGKETDAVALYKKTLEKRPNFIAALFNLGTLYLTKASIRDDALAQNYLDQAIQQMGKNHQLYAQTVQHQLDIKERGNIKTISAPIEKAFTEDLSREKDQRAETKDEAPKVIANNDSGDSLEALLFQDQLLPNP